MALTFLEIQGDGINVKSEGAEGGQTVETPRCRT